MQSGKPIIGSLSSSNGLNHHTKKTGQVSVLIRNGNGQPSKMIRISAPVSGHNLEFEYKEEFNPYSRRG